MSGDEELTALGARASDRALALVRDRFETGNAPSHLHYHNTLHTRGVIEKSLLIGAALGMTARELLLTNIAAAFHDTVQEWQAVPKGDGALIRVRQVGANEAASAREAVACMDGLGVRFAPEEKELVANAIQATIPEWSVPYGTVIQPFLTLGSHKVARAVALADLGSAGLDPPTFLSDGPNLFAEENLDLMGAVGAAQSASDIPADRQATYRARYLDWLRIQPDFARGRRFYFAEIELASLDAQSQRRLQALFRHYPQSIAAAEQALARAETASFTNLMRQLQPDAFQKI